MKLGKRSLDLIIITIYMITLFLGGLSFLNIDVINRLVPFVIILFPFMICCSIIFDNYKSFDLKKIKKVPLVIFVLTIIWLGITIFTGIEIGIQSFKGFIHFSLFITLFVLLFNCKIEQDQIKKIKNAFLVSFMICLIFGILQYIFDIQLNTYTNYKYPGIKGRINSTFYIATILDKYIVIMFSMVTYELLRNKNNWFLRILLILSTIGMTLTFSRSGQIIFLFITFIFLIISLLKKHFINIFIMIVSLIIMILIPGSKYCIQSSVDYIYDVFNIPESIQFNLLDIMGSSDEVINPPDEVCKFDCFNDEVDGSEFFRDYYKLVGMQFIKEYPVFGIGIGNTSFLYNNQNAKEYLNNDSIISDEYKYMYPHNGFIQVAEEIGIVGLLLLISMFVIFLFYSILKSDKQKIYIIVMLLIAFVFGNFTEGLFHTKQYIYIYILLLVLYCNICKNDYGKNINQFC